MSASRGPAGRDGTTLCLGDRTYDLRRRPLVLGILNRTRDSFYDGGAHWAEDAALRAAEEMVGDGADVIEIGARPGGVGVAPVSCAEESDLVCSTVVRLRNVTHLPLAVDTRRAAVAKAAYDEGVVLGNDMSGFRDPDFLGVSVRAGASVVATHCRLPPGIPDPHPEYEDVVADVATALARLAAKAEVAGLSREQIVLDPGLDLGKTWRQSLELLAAVPRMAALGFPILLAASNKIFLGRALDLAVEQRDAATVAAHAIGAFGGARLLRVHDVRLGRQVADLVAALRDPKGWIPPGRADRRPVSRGASPR